jgi:glycosyltransferase involved in cell wall biosynthesis
MERIGHTVELCGARGAEKALSRWDKGSIAILLGYADRFSSLPATAPKAVMFLWCQLSRPARAAELRGLLPVPLTEMTRQLLPPGVTSGPTIPHGVDTSVFAPPNGAEKAGGFLVGAVGANSPRKCFGRILRAFAIFAAEAPDANLVIKTDRIVSPDLDLARAASVAGISDRVRFVTEELPPRDMAALYKGMDVYINLSEWEGFCIPVIEAMSCGVPVVTHLTQGPGEILPYATLRVRRSREVRENGARLFLADPARAAAVLMNVYRDRSVLADAAACGRKAAIERYDIRSIARQWDRLVSGMRLG